MAHAYAALLQYGVMASLAQCRFQTLKTMRELRDLNCVACSPSVHHIQVLQ
jgi:hypothetical protein